ncbi:MAG: PP2C family protein-serine/threonine phosphatase [Rhodocyclaceae bacterium]
MRLAVAQCSHRGGRECNEDYLDFCGNESIGCFALADGTGGYRGGALAAESVVRQVLQAFSGAPKVCRETVEAALASARSALMRERARHPELASMNTTLATLMVDTSQAVAYWSHLGDSRIYLFRNGRAHVLTHDHSVLQALIDAGLVRGNPRGHVDRNTLYASVGSDETPPHAICEKPVALRPGDVFLLCTDGFWEALDESLMEALLLDARLPEQWINNMVASIPRPDAREQDNFSALAVWVGEREEVTRIQVRSR